MKLLLLYCETLKTLVPEFLERIFRIKFVACRKRTIFNTSKQCMMFMETVVTYSENHTILVNITLIIRWGRVIVEKLRVFQVVKISQSFIEPGGLLSSLS